MRVSSYLFDEPYSLDGSEASVQLVLCFGNKEELLKAKAYPSLHARYPGARIVFCSTSGEIMGSRVLDGSIVVNAIHLERSAMDVHLVNVRDFDQDSFLAGQSLAAKLSSVPQLKHLLILADGSLVNGSYLVDGINSVIPQQVSVTGGLAGDGDQFRSTLVGLDNEIGEGYVVGIGFCGESIQINHASKGGWEQFGPERLITRSINNELFEINHESALDLYKRYLGPYADQLPGSALLFPLALRLPGHEQPLVRTILSIDEERKSMTFAGNVPEGAQVRFMRSNLDRIIEAANDAGQQVQPMLGSTSHRLALLVSCVGRRIVLNNRVDEEVEAVCEALGDQTTVIGFYSYGEIAPMNPHEHCELHNQTMTITTIDELM
jgi:hypothetical protein